MQSASNCAAPPHTPSRQESPVPQHHGSSHHERPPYHGDMSHHPEGHPHGAAAHRGGDGPATHHRSAPNHHGRSGGTRTGSGGGRLREADRTREGPYLHLHARRASNFTGPLHDRMGGTVASSKPAAKVLGIAKHHGHHGHHSHHGHHGHHGAGPQYHPEHHLHPSNLKNPHPRFQVRERGFLTYPLLSREPTYHSSRAPA